MDQITATPIPTATARPVRLRDLLEEWQADAEAAYQARQTGTARGPVTGLDAIDRDLGGYLPNGVSILHGTSGAGKTAFGLQVAGECGCPALYVTCEMGVLELFRRVTARVTRTFLGRLKSGELRPDESLSLARQAAAAAPLLAFADATRGGIPAAATGWLRECAEVIRGDHPHLLIVVDSIHSWAEAVYSEAPEYEALNAALAGLRTLAAELQCPILGIAERNRASMRTGGLSAGAGSRKLEYGAEVVIDLDRKEDARPDPAGLVEVTFSLVKNRHGAVGRKVPMDWHGALQTFSVS